MHRCIVCRREVVQDDLALADARRWCVCLACYAAADGRTTHISGMLARELRALHLEPASSRDAVPQSLHASQALSDAAPAANTPLQAAGSDRRPVRYSIAQPEAGAKHAAWRSRRQPAALVLATYSLLMLIWGIHEAAFHAGVMWLVAGCSLLLFWGCLLTARFAARAVRQQRSRLGTLLSTAAVVWAAAVALLWLQHSHVLSAPIATAELVQLLLVGGVVAASSQLLGRFYREPGPAVGAHRRAPVTVYRVSRDESQR